MDEEQNKHEEIEFGANNMNDQIGDKTKIDLNMESLPYIHRSSNDILSPNIYKD